MHLEYGVLYGHYILVSVHYISIYENPEACLESSGTSKIKLFCENSQRLSEKWNKKVSYSRIFYATWVEKIVKNKKRIEFFPLFSTRVWKKTTMEKRRETSKSSRSSSLWFIFLTLGKFDYSMLLIVFSLLFIQALSFPHNFSNKVFEFLSDSLFM